MYFLGIDGGGTKTSFQLTNEAGVVLASLEKMPTNYLVDGLEQVKNVFKQGVIEICKEANIQVSDITRCFTSVAGFGDIKSDEPIVINELQTIFPELDLLVGNDTENALAGSLAGKPGINIIAGTGSIGLGRDTEGNTLRCGGWHHLFGGDEGSGYWIASKLLLAFTRQSDGRDKKTYLYQYLKDKFSWTDDSQMLTMIIEQWQEKRSKIASLAVEVTHCANQGDEVCISILKQAAKELSEIVLGIARGLNLRDIDVSYSGGVFKAQSFVLGPLAAYLSDYHLKLVEPILSPAAGAIILAMEGKVSKFPIEQLKQIE